VEEFDFEEDRAPSLEERPAIGRTRRR